MNISKAVGVFMGMVAGVVALVKESWRQEPQRLGLVIAIVLLAVVFFKAVVAMVLGAVFYKFSMEKNLWQNILPWVAGKRDNLLDPTVKASAPVVSGVAVNEPFVPHVDADIRVNIGGHRGNGFDDLIDRSKG